MIDADVELIMDALLWFIAGVMFMYGLLHTGQTTLLVIKEDRRLTSQVAVLRTAFATALLVGACYIAPL